MLNINQEKGLKKKKIEFNYIYKASVEDIERLLKIQD